MALEFLGNMHDYLLRRCSFFSTFVNCMNRLFRHISPKIHPLVAGMSRGLAGLSLIALSMGCSSQERKSTADSSDTINLPDDVIIMVGDSTLTRRDVAMKIPAGISHEDSLALSQSIVSGWLERMLVSEIAARNIDNMQEIDRLVEDYRKKLIIATYRRQLRESRGDEVDASDVEKYYNDNIQEMILEAPVVKGMYLKIPADASRLADIRRWMMTGTPDAIDNLEQYGLADAAEYSFFNDRWTDWSTISRQIPYNFGNPDEFVRKNKNFETTYRGFTYFLHISGFLPSGEKMPLEVADPIIREQLSANRGDEYEKSLIDKIYQQAEKEGRLKFIDKNYKPINKK